MPTSHQAQPPPRRPGGGRPGNGRQTGFRLPDVEAPPSPTTPLFPWRLVATLVFLVCIGVYAWLWMAGKKPVGWALLWIPILMAVTAPLFVHAGRTERRFDLGGLLAVGLLLRLAASYYRYEHAVDGRIYHEIGVRLADSFRQLNFGVDTGYDVPGTGTMRYISGLVHVVSNSDEFGAFLILTWFAFLGCYLLYRAFVTAVPDGDRYRYARLIFLWPSLVFWPSSIGKEGVLLFAIGVAALGAARLYTRRPGGYLLLLAGVVLAYLVRPHVAMIMLVALVAGLVLGRMRTKATGALTPATVAKASAIVLLLIASSVFATRTANFLGVESLQPTQTQEVLEETRQRTAQGGSEFSPADAASPIGYPQAVVTILFRPFPFETKSLDQFVTSIEALALALLTVASWRRLASVPRRLRTEPYVGLSLAFVLVFFFVFSVISNFGILVRQRTLMLPFAFVLLSVTAITAARKPAERSAVRR